MCKSRDGANINCVRFNKTYTRRCLDMESEKVDTMFYDRMKFPLSLQIMGTLRAHLATRSHACAFHHFTHRLHSPIIPFQSFDAERGRVRRREQERERKHFSEFCRLVWCTTGLSMAFHNIVATPYAACWNVPSQSQPIKILFVHLTNWCVATNTFERIRLEQAIGIVATKLIGI